jgi:hypothetical protein
MRIQSGQMISLGYGKYVRSDDVIAVEGLVDGRGPGRRALVWVRGLADPIVASRSEDSILADLVSPAEESARQQRFVLQKTVRYLDEIPGNLRRRIRDASGVDLDGLVDEANRVLS